MILISNFGILAAAAKASKFEFDGGAEQWRMDVLASALTGLALLPFALVLVWVFHRISLYRWLIVTPALATVFAVIASSLVNEFVAPIFLYVDQALQLIGVGQFMIYVSPNLLVCFVGSMTLAWWLKRNRIDDAKETFE